MDRPITPAQLRAIRFINSVLGMHLYPATFEQAQQSLNLYLKEADAKHHAQVIETNNTILSKIPISKVKLKKPIVCPWKDTCDNAGVDNMCYEEYEDDSKCINYEDKEE